MRRLHLLLLGLLGLALASCTGSSEQPIQALVAVASNGVDNKYQILFYASSTLQPGDLTTTTPPPVGTWPVDEPIVAIRYQRNLADTSDNKFWVLSQTHLRRYSTKGLTISNVGTPTPDGFDQLLGVDCSVGYLRLSPNNLLVVCPKINTSTTPPSESLTELPTAWLIDVNSPVLDPANPLQLTGFGGLDKIPVRLALSNNNQLMYLTPGFIGLGSNINDTTTQRSLSSLNFPLDANPKELVMATDSGGSIRAYGLLASSSSSETLGVSWDLNTSNAPLPFKESQVTSARIAPGSPPVVLFGTGLARIEGGQPQLPPNPLLTSQEYAAAAVGLDQFLYLGQKDSSYLWVVDLFPAFKDLTPGGVRQITLDATGNLRPISLAFIPVE